MKSSNRWKSISLVLAMFWLAGCSAPSQDFAREPLSKQELEQQQTAWMESSWESVTGMFPQAVRPDIGLVRYVESDEWVSEIIAKCMVDLGFEAQHYMEEDGVEFFGPVEQLEDRLVGIYTCQVQYPMRPIAPLSPELGYEYETTVLKKCLEAEGIRVPEPPSRQAYLEGADWNPYESLGAHNRANGLIKRKCPAIPPETGLP